MRRLAAGLAARGMTKGDKVLIHAENCPEVVLAWYACATVGAVGVTTNTRSVGAEMTYFAEHTDASAAVTQPQFAELVTEAAPDAALDRRDRRQLRRRRDAPSRPHGLESFAALLGDGADCPARPADPMAPVGIMFTSGTTSRPKAVVHTHANALWASRMSARATST